MKRLKPGRICWSGKRPRIVEYRDSEAESRPERGRARQAADAGNTITTVVLYWAHGVLVLCPVAFNDYTLHTQLTSTAGSSALLVWLFSFSFKYQEHVIHV